MSDQATPNLPSRDFAASVDFYTRVGFEVAWQDSGWLILERGDLTLEFFPYPDLNPAMSSFGSCLRLDHAEEFYDACRMAGVPERTTGFPRLEPLRMQPFGLKMGALLDADGSLLRIIQNEQP